MRRNDEWYFEVHDKLSIVISLTFDKQKGLVRLSLVGFMYVYTEGLKKNRNASKPFN